MSMEGDRELEGCLQERGLDNGQLPAGLLKASIYPPRTHLAPACHKARRKSVWLEWLARKLQGSTLNLSRAKIAGRVSAREDGRTGSPRALAGLELMM